MADRRIRVLWLAKGLGQGGMERLLVAHAKAGDRDRFDYRAAYLVERPHSVIAELERLGVPTVRLGTGNASDPRWVVELVRNVRRERIDVLHIHSPMPAGLARPAARALSPRTRLVYTEHNRWDRYSLPTRIVNRFTFALNHQAFAVSDDCRSSIPPRLQARAETLLHGIDIDAVAAHRRERPDARAELGIDEHAIVIGTVANLRAQKNYPLLLEVAKRVTEAQPQVRFVAVGQGPLEAELHDLHQRLELGDRFRFLGFRPDVHRVMSAFDVFCLSSDFEGLPVALMEAKALGLPVVATAVGGIPEMTIDGVDGLLCPPRNAEALVGALRGLALDPMLRCQLAAQATISSSAFAAWRFVEHLERSYSLLPRPQAVGAA